MELKFYVEDVTSSTNTLPNKYQLHLNAYGNYQEIEWLKKQINEMGEAKPVDAVVSQPSEPSFGQWIDVNDRLPKEQAEHVLISDGEDCFIGYYRDDTKSWDNFNHGWVIKYFHDGEPVYPEITKWMPLPKP